MTEGRIREIRINPIIPAESVLIATERAGRKEGKAVAPVALDRRLWVADCPFCRGNEHLTPETIVQVPAAGDWQLRVVRNRYPIFGDDSSLPELTLGLHRVIDGYGRHEVIIDNPNHGIGLGEMDPDHLAALFMLYRDRIGALYRSNDNFIYALAFKNFGPASGGSIPHTHSQIIAMPVVPVNVEMELSSSLAYYRASGSAFRALAAGRAGQGDAAMHGVEHQGVMDRTVAYFSCGDHGGLSLTVRAIISISGR
jgi:UDPglucose--hexose-1-phosphate uridylyltransferase